MGYTAMALMYTVQSIPICIGGLMGYCTSGITMCLYNAVCLHALGSSRYYIIVT